MQFAALDKFREPNSIQLPRSFQVDPRTMECQTFATGDDPRQHTLEIIADITSEAIRRAIRDNQSTWELSRIRYNTNLLRQTYEMISHTVESRDETEFLRKDIERLHNEIHHDLEVVLGQDRKAALRMYYEMPAPSVS